MKIEKTRKINKLSPPLLSLTLEGKSPWSSPRVCTEYGNLYKEHGTIDFPEQSWLQYI